MQNMERAMTLLQSVEIVLNSLLNEYETYETVNQIPMLKSVRALILETHNELLTSVDTSEY